MTSTYLVATEFQGNDIGEKCNNAIMSLPPNGGIIEIPAGDEYSFSTPIEITKSDVWLRGHGNGTVLRWTGDANGTAIVVRRPEGFGGRIRGTHISDFALKGKGVNGNQTIGIWVKSNVSGGNTLERLRIDGFWIQIRWGAPGGPSFDGTIREVEIDFEDFDPDPNQNDNPQDFEQGAIDLYHQAHSLTIDSCWIRGWKKRYGVGDADSQGIYVSGGSASVRIVNCNVEGMPGGNVILGDCNSVYIGHNYFEASGKNVPDGSGGTVNKCLDIRITSDAKSVVIDSNYHNAGSVDNQLTDPMADHVIEIEQGAKQPVIINNIFSNTRKEPIVYRGPQNSSGEKVVVAWNRHDKPEGVITDVGVCSFLHDPYKSGDAFAWIRQTDPNGFGLVLVPGNNDKYALSIQDKDRQDNRHAFYGNGRALLARGGGRVGIGTDNPSVELEVKGTGKATQWVTGDIIFEKGEQKLWRMFEEEDGLYLQSLITGRIYRIALQEVEKE